METILKVAVDSDEEAKAASVLKRMGLEMADLVQMAVRQTAKTGKLPFYVNPADHLSAGVGILDGQSMPKSAFPETYDWAPHFDVMEKLNRGEIKAKATTREEFECEIARLKAKLKPNGRV